MREWNLREASHENMFACCNFFSNGDLWCSIDIHIWLLENGLAVWLNSIERKLLLKRSFGMVTQNYMVGNKRIGLCRYLQQRNSGEPRIPAFPHGFLQAGYSTKRFQSKTSSWVSFAWASVGHVKCVVPLISAEDSLFLQFFHWVAMASGPHLAVSLEPELYTASL